MADHDQRFKTLLCEFFAEFFQLFFPEWAKLFDFAHVEWLDKEVFTDPPQGERRAVDLVARLPVLRPPSDAAAAGEAWIALVHVEVEAEDRVAPLRQRMFAYRQALRWRHHLPVLSIGLYLRVGLDGIGWDVYEEHFWGERLVQFRYPYIGLPALNGEDYLRGANLLGVALAALMRLPAEQRLELGRQAWGRLVQCPENEYRRYLLCECLNAYLPVDEAQRRAFEDRLLTTDDPKEKTMTVTIFDRLRQEGRLEGRLEGQREMLLLQLEARFGVLDSAVHQRVAELSAERLPEVLRAFAAGRSLPEMGLAE